MDNNFVVSFDNRFISTVYAAAGNSSFSNSGQTPLSINLSQGGQVLRDRTMNNHSEIAIPAHPNRMYADFSNNSTTDTSTQYSVINGPRSVFGAIAPLPRGDLATSVFNRWGTMNSVMISGDSTSQQYDYIDTTIYIRGLTSNTVLQLPFRFVRVSENT